jgi:quercetin dioxygenase-like cupin family protein
MTDRPEPYFQDAAADADCGASMAPANSYPLYELADGVAFRPVFGKNLMLNFVSFGPGRGFPTHAHPEEQLGMVLEGEMEWTIGSETRLLRKGSIYVVPANVPHEGHTMGGGCLVLDVFSPPRSGFRELIARANPLRSPARWWEPD